MRAFPCVLILAVSASLMSCMVPNPEMTPEMRYEARQAAERMERESYHGPTQELHYHEHYHRGGYGY